MSINKNIQIYFNTLWSIRYDYLQKINLNILIHLMSGIAYAIHFGTNTTGKALTHKRATSKRANTGDNRREAEG